MSTDDKPSPLHCCCYWPGCGRWVTGGAVFCDEHQARQEAAAATLEELFDKAKRATSFNDDEMRVVVACLGAARARVFPQFEVDPEPISPELRERILAAGREQLRAAGPRPEVPAAAACFTWWVLLGLYDGEDDRSAGIIDACCDKHRRKVATIWAALAGPRLDELITALANDGCEVRVRGVREPVMLPTAAPVPGGEAAPAMAHRPSCGGVLCACPPMVVTGSVSTIVPAPVPGGTGEEFAAAIRSLQPSQLEVAKEVMIAAVTRLASDNARLTAWKAGAMTELGGWDRLRPLADSRGGRIGKRLSDEVLRLWSADVEEIAALRARLDATEGALGSAQSALEAVEQQRDALTSDVARLTEELEGGWRAVYEAIGRKLGPDENAVSAIVAMRDQLGAAAPAPEPLAELTTTIHPDQGDGPWIVLSSRIAVPRGTLGRRARVVVLPEGEGGS